MVIDTSLSLVGGFPCILHNLYFLSLLNQKKRKKKKKKKGKSLTNSSTLYGQFFFFFFLSDNFIDGWNTPEGCVIHNVYKKPSQFTIREMWLQEIKVLDSLH